jgi:hypothetical protein
LHGDAIRDGTNRHFEIDGERILDVQDHVRPDELLESGLFHFDAVRSWRQIRQRVFARAIGRRFIAEIRAEVDGRDLRLTNHRRQTVPLVSGEYELSGKSRGASTAKQTVGGAEVGSIIGAIGGKGAAIGAGAGGALGAGSEIITKGDQVKVPSETLLDFTLQQNLSVPVQQN